MCVCVCVCVCVFACHMMVGGGEVGGGGGGNSMYALFGETEHFIVASCIVVVVCVS